MIRSVVRVLLGVCCLLAPFTMIAQIPGHVIPVAVQATPDSLMASDGYPRVIRQIIFDQRDVFDPESDDWWFGAGVMNALHVVTRPYILEDELLQVEGDEIDPARMLETERVLRNSRLFSKVRVTAEPVGADSVDMVVATQDQWSLRPDLLFGTGGGITNVGFRLSEVNFLGTATTLMGQGIYRTENDIGWEGALQVSQRRLFRTQVGVTGFLQATRFRTDQLLEFTKPFRNISTPWAFSLWGTNAFGKDFAYLPDTTFLLPFKDRSLNGWVAQQYGDDDRLFMSLGGRVSDVQRVIAESRQAFDNTAQILVSFASLRQDFGRTAFLNGYETEDIMEGGWGSVTLGRVFSMGNGGQGMWYVSGVGEQSWFPTERVYLFGSVGAGSGFAERAQPLYTFLEVNGLGHWRASDNFVLAARVRSQTAWNWAAYRQLVLDFESGLRGYDANVLAGDNRLISNVEWRWFPKWQVWILGISAVAFYDIGSVWDQGQDFFSARYHSAIGAGIRLHNLKASGRDAIFRFDFAFNLDENKFSGLIFSTNQLFSAFGGHQYSAPDVLGKDIDLR